MIKFSKFTLIVLFSFMFFSCDYNKCKINSQDDSSEVLNVLNKQYKAWNKGNLREFMKGYEFDDSIQFITRKGRTWGWQNVYEKYKKTYFDKNSMGKLTFKNMDILFLNKNTAQVYGNWELKNDTIFGGNFSVFLRKKKDEWKIFIDHTW
ncbi:MAG: DUF4440 domain-containing protein [Bacteroidia bacterium]|nr:DUF4440 domain-containing protein [Bacteroidia bacterium]